MTMHAGRLMEGGLSVSLAGIMATGACASAALSAGEGIPDARARTSGAEFPPEIFGLWESVDTACDFWDSQSRIQVTRDMLYGYEELVRPTRVDGIPGKSQAWRVEVEVDVGPSDDFQISAPIEFSLEGQFLVSSYKQVIPEYRRCPVTEESADPRR